MKTDRCLLALSSEAKPPLTFLSPDICLLSPEPKKRYPVEVLAKFSDFFEGVGR
jgi:hypothetical protein